MKWRVPIALVVLSLVPALGGIIRVIGLATHSGPATAEDVRFFASPVVAGLHIIGATSFSVIGAFQFSAELRRRAPRWHRLAGRVLAAMGLMAALSGLWMASVWNIPSDMQGALLIGARLVVGTAMTTSLVLAVRAILRRDVSGHEAWMIRAYALGQGAGTQVFLLGIPAIIVGGDILGRTRDVLMMSAWLLNAVIAELIIRRRAQAPRTIAVAAASTGSRALRAS